MGDDKAVALEALGLTRSYPMGEVTIQALRGVDLALYRGELLVMLGASGSGKSTLLNILGGLDSASGGEVRYVDVAAGRTWDPLRGAPPLPFERLLVYRNWFAPPAPLLRRRLVERVGGFDPGFRAVEDWDYWLRCLRHTEFRFVAGVVARYRLHPGQMHRDRPRMEQAHRRLVDKHFADDRTARRRHEAFRRLSDAMAARSSGAIGRAVWDLMRFLGSAGSPAEARVVWDLARRHPVPVREDDDGGRGHAGA